MTSKKQIMQNKPNFKNTKNVITPVITMTNNDEQRTTNYSKQTQSNPISVMAGCRCTRERLKKITIFILPIIGCQRKYYRNGAVNYRRREWYRDGKDR